MNGRRVYYKRITVLTHVNMYSICKSMAIRVPDLCDEIDVSSMIESHRYFAMDRKSTYIATTKLLKIFPKTTKKKKRYLSYL